MKRNIYLQMKSVSDARKLFFERIAFKKALGQEIVPVGQAVGRITARPVFARFSAPPFHAAAMDGIAVLAETTFGTTVDRPKKLQIGKDAFFINTGRPLPEGTDAVIMIEHVLTLDDQTVQIESGAYPWQYVRKVGEDIVATELVLPQNQCITPYDVGALMNGGIFHVAVKEKPRVCIIPTGSELITPEDLGSGALAPGQVVESNATVLGTLVEQYGGRYRIAPVAPDDFARILDAVTTAVEGDNHIVIISAGSSAGSEDYTAAVIRELGEVLVHGVTMMPGKPTVLGIVDDIPVMGNPGYPVSAIIAFEQFIRPLICHMLGTVEPERVKVKARTARKMVSKLGVDEFVRVKLGLVHDTMVASPLPRGAGSVTTLTEADGIMTIPSHVEGIQSGEIADVELLKDLEHIRNTVVVVGSHDNTLDLLANQMHVRDCRFGLSSSNVGSLGGLIALRDGHCHVAGCHLLDTETGTYNISYIRRYLPKTPVKLVNLVFREQGLIVPKGNPRGIAGIEDLVGNDCVFVNRQAGSGTRILLDYRLASLNIDPDKIPGYANEEFTHMSVAVAVLSGTADVGLGIYAAARALDLDFIPVVIEEYDLAVAEAFFEDEKIRFMLDVIRSEDFKNQVKTLGGYDTSKTGTVVAGL
jgi:putative molybdopterin biosynthesis protein